MHLYFIRGRGDTGLWWLVRAKSVEEAHDLVRAQGSPAVSFLTKPLDTQGGSQIIKSNYKDPNDPFQSTFIIEGE